MERFLGYIVNKISKFRKYVHYSFYCVNGRRETKGPHVYLSVHACILQKDTQKLKAAVTHGKVEGES